MTETSNVLVRQVPQWMTRSVKPEQPSVDDLEMRLADLERRHDKTRDFLLTILNGIVTVSALVYFQPGWAGTIAIIVVCNLFVPEILKALFLRD
jgi:hypothetical protein